ncbi:aminotransferase class V-fold PLP-dependent enzyme [Halodesulfurarchaeum sp.]|uniref:aminotransferase class V-fold PLP-dependent enzyme n=1 Tax=Halodesulfurarchaeum sp. TaxID=1980530 RepID=UPI002FC32132
MPENPWASFPSQTSVPDSLSELRADIPPLSDRMYFNWGASGPSPRTVVSASNAVLEYHEFQAPAGAGMYPVADEIFESARESIADLLGVSTAEIALTQSTTEGINRIATSIDWDPGDVIVTTDLEHAAGRLPWTRLEAAAGIDVRVLETDQGQIDLEALEQAVRDAELLCVSAIDWIYGRTHPVREMVQIAHEHDALALVDAVQAPGQRPVDLHDWNADFVAGAGHKWVLGPWGAGYLYVSETVTETLEPIHVGYRSVSEASGGRYEFYDEAKRFELGTMSPGPFAGLQTAIETIQQVGIDAIHEQIQSLRSRFVDEIPHDRLRSPPESPTGLITIQASNPESVVEQFDSNDISVRALPLPDSIRVSIHAMNTEAEIDALHSALHATWE